MEMNSCENSDWFSVRGRENSLITSTTIAITPILEDRTVTISSTMIKNSGKPSDMVFDIEHDGMAGDDGKLADCNE